MESELGGAFCRHCVAAALMKRVSLSEEFVAQLEMLRAKYRIKRNFIKLVEKKRKSLCRS